MTDIERIEKWLQRESGEEISEIIDTALHRHNVKKARRIHYQVVIRDVLRIIRSRNNGNR